MENNKNDRSGNINNNNNEPLFPSQSHVEMTQFSNQNSQRRNNFGPGEAPLFVQDATMNAEIHYREILGVLNRIAENREINMVSFAVVFIVFIFLVYLAIDFGISEGFTLRVPRDDQCPFRVNRCIT